MSNAIRNQNGPTAEAAAHQQPLDNISPECAEVVEIRECIDCAASDVAMELWRRNRQANVEAVEPDFFRSEVLSLYRSLRKKLLPEPQDTTAGLRSKQLTQCA